MKLITALLGLLVLALVVLGIVNLVSTSDVVGIQKAGGNPHYFWTRQIIWFLIAIGCCVGVACVNPKIWFSKGVVILMATISVLSLIYVFFFGTSVNGAPRWIEIAGFRIQPSEFVKLVVIIAMSWWHGRKWCKSTTFFEGLFLPFAGLGIVAIGFLMQNDFGSVIMMIIVNLLIMFVGGVRVKPLAIFALFCIVVMTVLVINNPNKLERITPIYPGIFEYLAEKFPSSESLEKLVQSAHTADRYQVDQSLKAFALGGLTGQGLGKSVQKRNFLPESHTDFVFSMLGEEFGYVATLLTVLMFVGVLVCGITTCMCTDNEHHKLLAFGMTMHICLSAGVNMGVELAVLPTKGLALPFLSYGGSSLVCSLIAVGFIIGVGARWSKEKTAVVRVRSSNDLWSDA